MKGTDPPWYKKQLRILQTVMREPDVVNYDAASVVRYMEEIQANCIVVNAGGVVDFFRHDLPAANPNPFMTTEDVLKDLTEACHEKDMKVIVRVDFRGVDKRIYELHPDWFAVDENGHPIIMESLFGEKVPHPYYLPCYLSYYRNEYAYQFTKVLFEKYVIDGIWENSYQQFGVCYCKTCQTKYRREIGKDLPRGGDFESLLYDEYRDWKAIAAKEHFRDFQKLIKSYGEDKTYCAEVFGLFHDSYKLTSTDLYSIKDSFDFLVTPMFPAYHLPLHAPSSLIKFLKNLDAGKTPVMIFGHLEAIMRYVAASPEETRIWMWQAAAEGGSLWNTTFNGQHPAATFDRRNAYLCKDVYAYMKTYENRLSKQKPVSEVDIFYSRSSGRMFGSGDRSKDHYVTNLIGLEQALRDQHIQYNIVPDLHFSLESLANTRILAIPNGAALSDEQVDIVRKYVENGGNLLATYQTSLFHDNGKMRDDFALSDVFGCTYTGLTKDSSKYGYQYIRSRHPITEGFEETQLLANWGNNLLVRTLPDISIEAPVTFVPPIFWQPPERAWLSSFETEYPTVVVNRFGKGRAVYFPYEPDRNVWVHGHQDFSEVLKNAFNYLRGERSVITTNAPKSVQISLNECTNICGAYILHAVNLTSFPRRPVAEIIPIFNINIEILVPAKQLRRFEVMKGDAEIRLLGAQEMTGNLLKVKLHIDELKEYTSVWIETETV